MPKDLLYASFKDAPYTSQFVGSIHPELKDAQQVLNQTYDLSKESDSKLAAVARDMAQKAHPKDTQAARALFEDYSTKLAERAKAGNYERMLHETTNDARQFNVNAGKIVENKKRIDEAYKKLMDDPNKSEAAKKSIWDNLIMRGQDSLGYDKNQGLVTGEGFKDKDIANDYSFSNEAFNVGKLVKDDIISGKYAATKNGAYGWYKPVTDKQGNTTYTQSTDAGDPSGKVFKRTSEGKLEEVSTQEINDTLTNYWKSNRAAQGYINREVDRNSIPALDAIDNSDLSPQEKQLAKQRIKDQTYQQLHQNEISPAIEAAKIALGYRKQSVGTDYEFNKDLDKSLGKTLTPNPLKLPQTRVLTSEKGVELPDLTIDDIKAAKSGGDYNKFLEEKGVSKLDRDRLGNDYRILSSKEPLANKIKSLSSSNPVIGSLVEAMTKAGANVTEENLLAAYNSAQTLLKHKYPVAETFNEDFEKADRLGILGQDNIQNFPEATKAMMFTDPQTGERYSFNNLPLSESLENQSWLGRIGIGKHIKTIGDLIEKDPEKVTALKQQMSNPVRILPFGNPGGVGINIGGKFYTSTSPLTQEETVQNDAIYKLNAASYNLNGGSKIIDVNQSFLKPIFEQDPSLSGIQKVQAQRNPIVDAHGNLLGFKTDVYEINKNGLRTSNKPITTLDNINNLYRSHARTSTDAFNVKGTGEGGEDFNETKTESAQ